MSPCLICRNWAFHDDQAPVAGHHPGCPKVSGHVGSQVAHSDAIGGFFEDAWNTVTAPVKGAVSAVTSAPSAAVNTGKVAIDAAKAAAPYVLQAVPYVQTALKNVPPMGTIASAAIGVLATGLQGGSLEEMAWAAAEGAAPSGVDTAVKAAHALRNGDSVLNAAFDVARRELVPGSAADAGFRAGEAFLKSGGNLSATGAAAARSALGSNPQAVAAFDMAIGTLARANIRKSGGVSVASNTRIQPMVSSSRMPTPVQSPPRPVVATPPPRATAQAVTSAVKIVTVSSPSDVPLPLPMQPFLVGPTPGLLVTSDGRISKGVYAPGTSGVRGLLVLGDGRIARSVFKL